MHAAAAACLGVAIPGLPGAALAALALALGAAAAWDRALLRGARALRSVEIGGPDSALLLFADGSRAAAALGARRRVNRYWVSLPVRAPVRRTLFLAADMLEPERFRLLRLWALWGRVPASRPGNSGPERSP